MSDIDWMRVDAAAQRSIHQDHMATAIENGLSRGANLFLRRLVVSWGLAAVLVFALTAASFIARGAVQSAPGDTGTAGRVVPAPASTSLPLQSRGLAISGDVQRAATNVARFPVTKKQLEKIHRGCRDAVEIASTGSDACRHALVEVVTESRTVSDGLILSCLPRSICLLFRKFPPPSISPPQSLTDSMSNIPLFAEVADQRPSGLCNADPDRVCMRIGMMPAMFQSVLKYIQPSSPSSPTTASATPTTPPTTTPAAGDTATTPPSGDTATTPEIPPATPTPVP